MAIVPLLASSAAFLLFGVATDRRHRRHLGRWHLPRRAGLLLAVGWLLLAVNMVAAVAAWGAVFGPIAAFGAASLGAFVGFLLLNLLPIDLRRHRDG